MQTNYIEICSLQGILWDIFKSQYLNLRVATHIITDLQRVTKIIKLIIAFVQAICDLHDPYLVLRHHPIHCNAFKYIGLFFRNFALNARKLHKTRKNFLRFLSEFYPRVANIFENFTIFWEMNIFFLLKCH
jgi:hypothetical protein